MIKDVFESEWHPFITFINILEKLPEYVTKVKSREKEGVLYSQNEM